MTQGRGRGKTPQIVVDLLKDAVGKTSQSFIARELGITQSAIHRYLNGTGEPSSETVKKMSDYFDIPEWELRGEKLFESQEVFEAIDESKEFINRLHEVKVGSDTYFKAIKIINDNLDFIQAALIEAGLFKSISDMKAQRESNRVPGVVPKKKKSDK